MCWYALEPKPDTGMPVLILVYKVALRKQLRVLEESPGPICLLFTFIYTMFITCL